MKSCSIVPWLHDLLAITTPLSKVVIFGKLPECVFFNIYKWNETPSHSRRLLDVLAILVRVRARKGRKARRRRGGSRTFMLLIYFSFSRHFRQTMRLNSILYGTKLLCTTVFYHIDIQGWLGLDSENHSFS